ncbi:hypothetical protein B566_EDAN004241 [Ephemera danica]|nr:hypothetical protein B566_EDAN004241 [Ephemera danica]
MLLVADETGIRLTVRGCALDSGTLTTDTEIIRMSHCGGFYFDENGYSPGTWGSSLDTQGPAAPIVCHHTATGGGCWGS